MVRTSFRITSRTLMLHLACKIETDRRSLLADVLVPKLRMRFDELRHQRDAAWILNDFDPDATRSKQLLFTEKRLILADDHVRNAVEQNCAAAHRARRQRGVDHALAINSGGLPAGVLEGIHLAMQNRAALLHAPIVSASDDPAA